MRGNRRLAATAAFAIIGYAGLTFSALAAETADESYVVPGPAFEGQTNAPRVDSKVKLKIETLVEGMVKPRSISLMPDGSILIAQRDGKMRILAPDGKLSDDIQGLRVLSFSGPKGLQTVTLDPNFARNRALYVSYFEALPGEQAGTRTLDEYRNWAKLSQAEKAAHPLGTDYISSAVLSPDGKTLTDIRPILGATGRRILFAGDGTFFTMTTGATGDEAQRLNVLDGKILRVNLDGSIPGDNPFAGRAGARQEIYSYGHRDPDGAAFDPATGLLWASEHGPKGGDELNVIRPGKNYGWPVITYGTEYSGEKVGDGITQKEGMVQPNYYWEHDIAPSGMIFYTGDMFPEWKGNMFVGALLTKQLVRLVIDGERVTGEERLLTDLDRRIRDIKQGPDGALYVLTDSEDNADLDRHFPGVVIKLTRE